MASLLPRDSANAESVAARISDVKPPGHLVHDPAQSDPNAPFVVPDPPQGGFAAVTDMNGPGTRILYRDVELEGRLALRLTVFYTGEAPFSTPDTLAYESPEPNQQFRIDLIDPSAPIDSVAEDDVLLNVFRTSPGDPTSLAPTAVRVDLSPEVFVSFRRGHAGSWSASYAGLQKKYPEGSIARAPSEPPQHGPAHGGALAGSGE